MQNFIMHAANGFTLWSCTYMQNINAPTFNINSRSPALAMMSDQSKLRCYEFDIQWTWTYVRTEFRDI